MIKIESLTEDINDTYLGTKMVIKDILSSIYKGIEI